MKLSLLYGFILVFLISSQFGNAQTVDAEIADVTFPAGDWYRQNGQGGACVTVKNTGDVGHLFWVQYTVMDETGYWWEAPYESVYLNPGETSDWTCPIWTIPDDAPYGSYQAELAVWEGYDDNSGSLYNLLDRRDQAGSFTVEG